MATKQTILITGATAGIGRYTALHLTRGGHHVIASGRSVDALNELRTEAAGIANGGKLDTVRLDVTSAASIEAAVAECDRLTAGRGVDVLVNNAGFGIAVPVAEITDADLRAQFDTNVFGLVAMVRAFVPQMRARGRGRIVNISSIGGKMTLPFFGGYNSTKHAVESLSDAMRVELKPFGIEVAIVEPGAIRTNFATRTVAEASAYRKSDSVYASAHAAYVKMAKRADDFAPGPHVIARAIEKASTARRPRVRYVAPFFGARVLLAVARLMPVRLVDFVMGQALGLTRKKLAASSSTATAQKQLASAGVRS